MLYTLIIGCICDYDINHLSTNYVASNGYFLMFLKYFMESMMSLVSLMCQFFKSLFNVILNLIVDL